MKRTALTVFLIFTFLAPACWAQESPQGQPAASLPPIQVFPSPKGDCTEAVVKEIDL